MKVKSDIVQAGALRRSGREITILEQSSQNRELGALISLQPNASRMAEKLGIAWYFDETQVTMDSGFHIYDQDGHLNRKIDFDLSSPASVRAVFHRIDLHNSLKRAATSENGRTPVAKIQASSRVVSCDPLAGTATLENGTTLSSAIIIGADGIHSVLRRFVIRSDEDATQFEPRPTGVSAYRLLLSVESILRRNSNVGKHFDPAIPVTSMVLGDQQRIVMGPARDASVFGITALVPDERMHEHSNISRSWTSHGSGEELLQSFKAFPDWIKGLFATVEEIGSAETEGMNDIALWQLRDIEPMPRWSFGRLISAGDAAHAMLPTQGQGVSQSFQDAEALAEFLDTLPQIGPVTLEQVEAIGLRYFNCRRERASLIQAYSRQHGVKTLAVQNRVTWDPTEFMRYNTNYEGAKDWERRLESAVVEPREAGRSHETESMATATMKV